MDVEVDYIEQARQRGLLPALLRGENAAIEQLLRMIDDRITVEHITISGPGVCFCGHDVPHQVQGEAIICPECGPCVSVSCKEEQ